MNHKAERAAIADALANRAKAEQDLADAEAKLAQMKRAAAAAEDAAATARTASDNAQSDRVRRLVDGLSSEADPTIKLALDKAEEDLVVTREAARILKEKIPPAEERLARAKSVVEDSVNALLGTLVGELLQEAEELRVKLEAKRVILLFLKDRLFDRSQWTQRAPYDAVNEYLGRIPFPMELGVIPQPDSHPAYVAWADAVHALEHDPSAPLPSPEYRG